MPDYDLDIDGKKYNLHWDGDKPPSDTQLQGIIHDFTTGSKAAPARKQADTGPMSSPLYRESLAQGTKAVQSAQARMQGRQAAGPPIPRMKNIGAGMKAEPTPIQQMQQFAQTPLLDQPLVRGASAAIIKNVPGLQSGMNLLTGTTHPNALQRGVREAGSMGAGFTSPQSISEQVLFSKFLGAVGEGAKALGVSKKLAAIPHKAIGMLFGSQMGIEAYQKFKKGQSPEAVVDALAGLGLAFGPGALDKLKERARMETMEPKGEDVRHLSPEAREDLRTRKSGEPIKEKPAPTPARQIPVQPPENPVQGAAPQVALPVAKANEAHPSQAQPANPVIEPPAAQAATMPAEVPVAPKVENVPPPQPQAPESKAQATAGVKPDGVLTGAKNAYSDQERADFGLPEVGREKVAHQDIYDEAMRRQTANPSSGIDLAKQINQRKKPMIDSTDTMHLLITKGQLIQAHAAHTAQADAALAQGDQTGYEDAKFQAGQRELEFDEVSGALIKGGSEVGRALGIRRREIGDDMSLLAMKQRARVAKGEPLTKTEEDRLGELSQQYETAGKEYQARIAALEEQHKAQEAAAAQREQKAASKAADRLVQKAARESRSSGRRQARQDLATEREQIHADLKKILGGKVSANPIPIEALPHIGKLVRNYVKDGVIQTADIVDRITTTLKDAIPSVTTDDVQRAIARIGYESNKREISDVSKRVAEIKKEIAQQYPLEERSKRPDKKEHFEEIRNKLRSQAFQLEQKLVQMRKEGYTPPEEKQRAKVDEETAKLKARLADLKRQEKLTGEILDLKAGKFPVKPKFLASRSAEVEALLKEKQAELKALQERTGTAKKPAGARAKVTREELMRRYNENLKKRIDSGDTTRPERRPRTPLNDAEKKLATTRGELEAQLQDKPPKAKSAERAGPKKQSPRKPLSDAQKQMMRNRREALFPKKGPSSKVNPEEYFKGQRTRLQKAIDKTNADIEAMKAGTYEKPGKRERRPMDEETARLFEAKERARRKAKAFEAAMKKPDRMDVFLAFQRAAVLSSTATVGKLTGASVVRPVVQAYDEVIGHGMHLIAPNLSAKATYEGGGFDAKSLTRAMMDFVGLKAKAEGAYPATATSTSQDIRDVLSTGVGSVELRGGKVEADYDKYLAQIRDKDVRSRMIHYMGIVERVHAGLKTPAKRFAFQRALSVGIKQYQARGLDPTDPATLQELMAGAYTQAQVGISQQPNFWGKSISYLIASAKREGISPVAAALRYQFPVSSVPFNILAEARQRTGLGLIEGAAKPLFKGVKNMTPQEADLAMRALKRGGTGPFIAALGILLDKVMIPKMLEHIPAISALVIWQKTSQALKGNYKDKDKSGAERGTQAAFEFSKFMISHQPFYGPAMEMVQGTRSAKEFVGVGANEAGELETGLLGSTARLLDTPGYKLLGEATKRTPQSLWEGLEMNLPGLRQKVQKSGTRKSSTRQSEGFDTSEERLFR